MDHKGRTALHLACLSELPGSGDICFILLRRGAYLHGTTARNRLTALHCACLKGKYDIARLLIKYGAFSLLFFGAVCNVPAGSDLHAKNSDDLEPLQLLERKKDTRKFIERARGVTARNHSLLFSLSFRRTVVTKPPEVGKFTKKDKEFLELAVLADEGAHPFSSFPHGIFKGRAERIMDALDKGVDVNVCDESTLMTPLMCAARQGLEMVCRVLLFHCADVHKQDVGKCAACLVVVV